MESTVFKNIMKKQATNAAFRYLREKQESGKKGKTIKYEHIQMAYYLVLECYLSVSDITEMFAFLCQMNGYQTILVNKNFVTLNAKK